MRGILGLMLLVPSLTSFAVEEVGEIGYMSGRMVAQRADGTIKVMAPKAKVLEGDILVTSDRGYAQVKMNDGTVMTMRPDSNLKIEAYKFRKDAPESDNAVYRLIKGGFRTVSGLIGKRGNPDAYKLRAAAATIGIRGTDFSVRLCGEKDCTSASSASSPAKPPARRTVGRVMLLKGEMSAQSSAGQSRRLLLGSSVYEGEVLNTGAETSAVVAFRDGGRITLQENSAFHIERFKYNEAGAEEGAVLRLLKGSVRTVTGLIGRVNHENYKFHVSTATIGIRGTGFDAWCNAGCVTGSDAGATVEDPLAGAGVYVWSGAVVLNTPKGSFDVGLQQAAIIARNMGTPIPLPVVPKSITENAAPRPDGIPVDMDKEFGPEAGGEGSGLYVTVHNGEVILTQGDQQVALGSGESGLAATGGGVQRLSYTPAFFEADKQNTESLDGGAGSQGEEGQSQEECVVVP